MSSNSALFRLVRLARKELTEILRDRRTIITLVLMPVLLYPLLGVAFQQFYILSQFGAKTAVEYRLGFSSDTEQKIFMDLISWGEKALQQQARDAGRKEEPTLELTPLILPDLDQALENGEIVLAVVMPDAQIAAPRRDRVLSCDIRYLTGQPAALDVRDYVERRLAAAQRLMLESRLNLRFAPFPATVLRVNRSPVAAAGTADAIIPLSSLVPLILILMTITGAVYPAIDLTAGERERGTLEILVAAPVPRFGLLFAKYVTVLTVALLTAVVNLTAMTVTLLLSGAFQQYSLSIGVIIQVFGLLVLFAAFFSAVLLCLTSFARSFKEAQAYLIPLMLASLGPGLIGMIPGLKLDLMLAAAPLVNIVLLGRDLFEGGANLYVALLVVITTLLYAGAALALAARIFGAESVLYSENAGWGDLFRRSPETRPAGSIASALLCLAAMVPGILLAKGLLRLFDLSLMDLKLMATLLAAAMFVGLPLLAAWHGRLSWKSAFGLHPPPFLALTGALVMGVSLWPIVLHLVLAILGGWLEQLKLLVDQAQIAVPRQGQAALLVSAAALAGQGCCEELFFRGYLFQALRERLPAWATIVVSAALFGLSHAVLGEAIGLAQLVPSTLMGLVLGWVAWTSGSVAPSMVLHGCHNAILQVVAMEQQTLQAWWLFPAVGGVSIGAMLVWLGRQKQQ